MPGISGAVAGGGSAAPSFVDTALRLGLGGRDGVTAGRLERGRAPAVGLRSGLDPPELAGEATAGPIGPPALDRFVTATGLAPFAAGLTAWRAAAALFSRLAGAFVVLAALGAKRTARAAGVGLRAFNSARISFTALLALSWSTGLPGPRRYEDSSFNAGPGLFSRYRHMPR